MPISEEIVELIIDAKNLSDKELREAAVSLEKLGKTADKTEKELDQLTISQKNLERFIELENTIRALSVETAKSEVRNKEYAKSVNATGEATESQRIQIINNRKALSEQNKALRSQQKEYKTLEETLKSAGVNTRTFNASLKKTREELTKNELKLKNINKQYSQSVSSLKKLTAAEKEAQAIQKQINQEKKESAEADLRARNEIRRVNKAIKDYEIELRKLNKQLRQGKISKADFIAGEKRLRTQLKLTELQVKRTNAALTSEGSPFKKRIKSTDALTKVTRRLAQAYTVVIAAQKAAAAVGASVKGYGELEAAVTKVEKTTSLTKDQLQGMTEQLQIMAKDVTPTAANELLRYAEIAGQLGAEGSEDILRIAAAADALQLSTDLAGDEAVTLLSRMLKMTQEGLPAIDNLSSSIVELGNTFAASESEITQMTKEVITGTTSINLGSAAAAGFAATLKEMGQTGERSRSSLFKMSQAIKSAAVNGGEDLKNLAAITKLTGEEIDEALGEKPEQVLIAFVEGLKKVKDEGGLVSQELQKFGITGVEATSVIEVLADQTDRLKEAVSASSQAYADGDKHIKEAIKAYANQDAKIGRLANKFTELKTKVGEAFADETNQAVDALSGALDGQSENVIVLAENMADLGEGIFEVLQQMEEWAESIGIFDAVGFVLLNIKKAFNDIQILIDQNTIRILEFRKVWNALWRDSEEFIELTQRQEELEERIAGNRKDRANAVARLNGQSSASYEDLLEVVEKNADAVSRLSDEEKEQIENATKLLGFKENTDAAYRKLTASIIEQVRNLEAEEALKKKISNEEKAITEAQEKRVSQQRKLNALTIEAVRNNGDLEGKLNALKLSVEEGYITWDEYLEKQKQVMDAKKAAIPIIKEIAEKTKDTAVANEEASKSAQGLVDSIREQKKEISDLRGELKATSRNAKEYADVQRELARATKQLVEDEKELATTRKLEKKTLNELFIIQSAHLLEVQKLDAAYKAGRISVEEYKIKSEELSFKTKFLNDAIGENTSIIERNAETLDEGNDVLQERIKLMREWLGLDSPEEDDDIDDTEEMAQAVSLWAIAQNRLNKELDFTDLTIDELKEASKELNKEWKHVRTTAGGWWDDLKRLNNEAVRREQSIIKETIQLKKLEEQVASGSLTMRELDRAAKSAVFSFKALGDEQLAPLRAAIRAAKAEFQDLSDTINDSFADVEDRLDAILGNEQDIVKRKFKREMDELLELLDRAKESGDNKLIQKINEAIRSLKKAQDLEFKDQFGTNNTRSATQQQETPSTGIGGGPSSAQIVTVNLNFAGTTSSFNFADQASADSFIAAMESLQEINSQGIG